MSETLREELAEEAARLVCEEGIHDFRLAKDKAMKRMGVRSRRVQPSNVEIDDAVGRYLELFADETAARTRSLRELAIKVMQLCAEFQPRLVGDVLRGRVTAFSVIQLHLFTDVPEAVDMHLANRHVPFEHDEKRFRHPDGRNLDVPLCQLVAGDQPVELALFGVADLRWSPVSPATGKPMQRASLGELQALVSGRESERG